MLSGDRTIVRRPQAIPVLDCCQLFFSGQQIREGSSAPQQTAMPGGERALARERNGTFHLLSDAQGAGPDLISPLAHIGLGVALKLTPSRCARRPSSRGSVLAGARVCGPR